MLDRVTPIPAVQRKESKPESKKQPQNEGMRRNSDWHQDMFSMARNGQGGAPAQMKEEEPAQKKEEETAQKKGAENAALQMKEEEPAAQKKEEEPAAQKKEEEPAAQKKEEEPAQKKEEEPAQKKEEEPAAQKKEEEPAQKKEEEPAAQKKEEEPAQKKEEEPAAQKKEEEPAQKKEEEPAAQKKEEEPAQKKEEEPAAQKKEEEPAQQKEAGAVQTTSGKGRRTQMPGHVQRKMEQGLGADFGSTRIHADSEKASRMGAQAYTQGEDIYFAKDKYDPESKQGQELLGHELQHVVQQRDGRVKANHQEKGIGVNNERSLEGEADAKGKQVAEK
jgi:hypothetical protein